MVIKPPSKLETIFRGCMLLICICVLIFLYGSMIYGSCRVFMDVFNFKVESAILSTIAVYVLLIFSTSKIK